LKELLDGSDMQKYDESILGVCREAPKSSEANGLWEDEDAQSESTGALDDPVQLYLREIGRVRLLTFSQEQALARKLDLCEHLEALEKELVGREGQPPQPWEITVALLHRLVAATP
jgi:sigma-70-like protein